ncbi:MAG: translation elongation factor Ts [Patescibacteria group bacterium]|nr:translation elongation factor Ts [Patescibacteria group bacterium]
MAISYDQILKLREKTGAPVMRAKKVLDEVGGDLKKAEEVLKKEGFEKADKRADRATSQGVIETYVHHSGKIAAIVEVLCETDFVAKNSVFREMAHNLALQLASLPADSVEAFLNQDYIKDPSKKVSELVREVIAKTGENCRVSRIWRIELGGD